jgi:hypothetical protein
MTDCAVIIPVRNGGRWLAATLQSVLSQSAHPAEIMVVDDGSTDDSPQIATQFPGVRVLSSPGTGVSAARNHGLANTRAALVAFFDQDDLWHLQHLEALAALLSGVPEAPAAMSDGVNFPDGSLPRLESPAGAVGWLDRWRLFPFGSATHCPGQVLVRRRDLERAGGWSPEFDGVEDLHLWLRLADIHPFPHLRSTTVGRRLHPDSHYHEWLAKRPGPYLNLRCRASHDAARRRLERLAGTAEGRLLAWQLRLLTEVTAVATALHADDRPALAPAAARLEAVMAEADRREWGPVLRYLVFGLCLTAPAYIDLECRRRLLLTLWEHWPAADSPGRSALRHFLAHRLPVPPIP